MSLHHAARARVLRLGTRWARLWPDVAFALISLAGSAPLLAFPGAVEELGLARLFSTPGAYVWLTLVATASLAVVVLVGLRRLDAAACAALALACLAAAYVAGTVAARDVVGLLPGSYALITAIAWIYRAQVMAPSLPTPTRVPRPPA